MKNSTIRSVTLVLLIALTLIASVPIQAQQPDRPRTSVTINTDLVVTWAQVFDNKDEKVVKGLEKDDFILKEDDLPQQINLVKEGGQPLSVVFIVWGMGCFRKSSFQLPRIHESLRQLGDNAEIAAMSMYGDVALVEPLTLDHNVIADWILYKNGRRRLGEAEHYRVCETLHSNNPATRTLPRPGEAIYQAARYLEKEASPGRRKIIIVMTYPMWINTTHRYSAAEVSELLEKTRTTVYALYTEIMGSPKQYPPDSKYRDTYDMYRLNRKDKGRRSGGLPEDFVEHTGGTTLVAKYTKDTDETLMKLTGLISSSYTIGYYPENSEFDGKFRRISLELSPRGKAKAGKVTIKTRNGYRAIRSSSTAATQTPPGK
jgi:VWFA-related protein